MAQSEDREPTFKQIITYAIYAVTIYGIVDDLTDQALSEYLEKKYAAFKCRLLRQWKIEQIIHKETGPVIWEALEIVNNEC